MPRARTTADLLTDVRARVAAPSANGLISSAELLELADEEMRTELAHLLVSIRSEYWLTSETTTITSGTASYRMPARALGMALRDVTVYDAQNNEWNAVQVPADQRYLWSRGQTWAPSGPFAFTMENGHVVLLPTPAASGYTLRIRYYARPNRLDLTTNCVDVAGSTTTVVIAGGTVPATIAGYCDIVYGAGMHEVIYADRLVSSVVSTTITLESSTPIDPAQIPGSYANYPLHYIARSGYTPLPPVPEALWPLLVALTCRAYCEAIGDMRGLEAAAMAYERKKKAALGILDPRVDGEQRRPVPMHTPLRGGRRYPSSWGVG